MGVSPQGRGQDARVNHMDVRERLAANFLYLRQRLFEIRDQIFDVLDANG